MTFVMPERYTASALILIRPLEPRRVVEPGSGMREKEVLGFPLTGANVKIIDRSYAEIIQSRAIAKRVVDELRLDQVPRPVESSLLKRAWNYLTGKIRSLISALWCLLKYGRVETQDPYENLVDGIEHIISAEEIRDTYLVRIEANSEDPAFSALVANTAAKVFVDYWQKTYEEETRRDLALLQGQLESNTAEWNALLNAKEDYKKEEGIADLEAQVSSKIAGLGHFEGLVRQTETDIREMVQERKEIERELAGLKRMSTAETVVGDNPIVVMLEEKLGVLEIDMAGLLSRYTPTHSDVIALQAKIDETQKRLATEEARKVSNETSTFDPVYLQLEERLAIIDTKLPALEERRDGFKATAEQYLGEVEELRNKMKELDILEQKAEVLRGVNYEFVAAVKDSNVLATKKAEEIRVASSATPPLYPSGPIKIRNVGIAAVVSLIIGIGLAFFLEYINIRIRSIEEAEHSLDLPVLATIPRIKSLGEAEFPEVLIPAATPGPS